MSFLHDEARATIEAGLSRADNAPGFLAALMQVTADRLAEHIGHDRSCAVAASVSREQAQKATRARGRNRR